MKKGGDALAPVPASGARRNRVSGGPWQFPGPQNILSFMKSGNIHKPSSFLSGTLLHVCILLLEGTAIYSNTLRSPFVFDDTYNIVENPVIKDFRSYTHEQYAKMPMGKLFETRFVGYLTFALNYKLHGLHVTGYHIVNLLIHLGNALLVYWLVVLAFQRPEDRETGRLAAVLSALLFISHPLQTQAVTYIVQRLASLAATFYLLALILYVQARRGSRSPFLWYCGALVSAVLAMKTKETAITLPVMIALSEYLYLRDKTPWTRRLLALSPFFLTMLIIPLTLLGNAGSLLEISAIDRATQLASLDSITRGDYFLTQLRVVVTYVRLLLLPVDQKLLYDYEISRSFLDGEVLLSLSFHLFMLGLALTLLLRSRKYQDIRETLFKTASFGILWFYVTLSVESSIIPIRDVIFEHRLYLPSAGFFISFVMMVFVPATEFPRLRKIIVPFMMSIVLALSTAACARNSVWKDEISLWGDVVKKSPRQAGAYRNLGNAYHAGGRLDDAIAAYQAASTLNYFDVNIHNNLGSAYDDKGQFDKALTEFQIGLRMKPDDPYLHYNLGVTYEHLGSVDRAVKEYRTAIALKPDYADPHNNLGEIFFKGGRIGDALHEFQTAISINPDFEPARNNLNNLAKTTRN